MSYRIKRRETPTEAVLRIVAEQTEAALADLADPDARGAAEAVLECRKRCKKIRGLLRLAQPTRPKQAKRLDRIYREAARCLAGCRDAHATLDTLDRLIARTQDLPQGLGPVRRELIRRSDSATAAVERGAGAVHQARELLNDATALIDGWTAGGNGWRALGPGFESTYARGAAALADLLADPTSASGHELRKQAKSTWYHLRLLQRSAPSILVPLAADFKQLVDGLGEANDLAVLLDLIDEDPGAFGIPEEVDGVRTFLDNHRAALIDGALARARRLYVESPPAIGRRLGRYWKVWHRYGPDRPIGYTGNAGDPGPEDGLDDLTVAQLRPLARDLGLTNLSSRRRFELLADLRAHGVTAPPA